MIYLFGCKLSAVAARRVFRLCAQFRKERGLMKTVKYPEELIGRTAEGRCVLALGFFDGVHLAHRQLLAMAKAKAEELSLPLAVFTFASEGGGLKRDAVRLYTTEQKLSILESVGVDITYLVSFQAVSGLSPEDFIKRVIAEELQAEVAVCGYNFRFGKGASAGAAELSAGLRALGRECIILPEYRYLGMPLSSSYIRALLAKGDARQASAALGVPYFVEGEVLHGDKRGSELGIPTVNIPLNTGEELLRRGVYATAVYIDARRYPAISNVGECPTFGSRAVHTETFIFGFSGDLYEKNVRVYFLDFIRDEMRFKDGNELIMQIEVDKIKANKVYRETKWQDYGLS